TAAQWGFTGSIRFENIKFINFVSADIDQAPFELFTNNNLDADFINCHFADMQVRCIPAFAGRGGFLYCTGRTGTTLTVQGCLFERVRTLGTDAGGGNANSFFSIPNGDATASLIFTDNRLYVASGAHIPYLFQALAPSLKRIKNNIIFNDS